MVNRCKAAGVGIFVDAVINHMTNFPSPGVGSNGTAYTKYSYPGLYTPVRLPHALRAQQLPERGQRAGLRAVLAPGPQHRPAVACGRRSPTTSSRSARLGVAGFRIDAAKHMQQVELDDIIDAVNSDAGRRGARRCRTVFLEVIGGAGEAVRPRDYFGVGYGTGGAADITEFTFAGVGDKFRNLNGAAISQLNPNGRAGQPVLRGGVGTDAVRQGGGLPPEPRHPARLRHRLPRWRRLPPRQRLDAGAAVRLSRRCCRATRSPVPPATPWARPPTPTAGPCRWSARRASRRRRSASGSASIATRRSATWCGSAGSSPARPSPTGGTTAPTRIAFSRGDRGFVGDQPARLEPLHGHRRHRTRRPGPTATGSPADGPAAVRRDHVVVDPARGGPARPRRPGPPSPSMHRHRTVTPRASPVHCRDATVLPPEASSPMRTVTRTRLASALLHHRGRALPARAQELAPDSSWVARSALYQVFVSHFSPDRGFPRRGIAGLDRIEATGADHHLADADPSRSGS